MRDYLIGLSLISVSLLSLPLEELAAGEATSGVGFALENGDTNGDLERDVSDGIYLLSHLFLAGPAPVPLAYCASAHPAVENGDSNGDAAIDISDPVHLLFWLFLAGPSPAAACADGFVDKTALNSNPRIIPPHAKPYGKSYGEWAAAWWQWAFSLPQTGHPLSDLTGEQCGAGQSGPVWFLGMPLPFLPPQVTRHCTVPAGKSLLIPLLMGEASTAEGSGETEDELRANSEAGLAGALACSEFEGDIDGVSIQDLDRYLFPSSPLFEFGPIPEDGLFDIPAGTTSQAIATGLFLLLSPPSAGEHVIHVRRSVPECAPVPLTFDLTYIITVEG